MFPSREPLLWEQPRQTCTSRSVTELIYLNFSHDLQSIFDSIENNFNSKAVSVEASLSSMYELHTTNSLPKNCMLGASKEWTQAPCTFSKASKVEINRSSWLQLALTCFDKSDAYISLAQPRELSCFAQHCCIVLVLHMCCGIDSY